MDYHSLLYSPVYDVLGVTASLTPNRPAATAVPLVVLDKTAGVSISEAMDMMSLRPAAVARMREILAAGVVASELDGGTINFNGRTWRIDMHHMRPSPGGERSGEVLMFLSDEGSYA